MEDVVNKIFKLITKQIEIVEQSTGAEIIIYDNYDILGKTELSKLPQFKRWHFNKYCIFVKENPQIFRKCTSLKHTFFEKVSQNTNITKSTCFCGVAEFAAPILINGINFGIIALTGFIGDFSERKCKNLAKRLNISLDKLLTIQNEHLKKIDNQITVEAQLEILIFLIKEFIINESKALDFIKERNKLGNSYILKALEYIERNFTKDISVKDVAKNCFISVPYLQSQFSQLCGHGVAEEIRNKRIEYAKELLLTTEYSIKQIAFSGGFKSADYFSVVFNKHCNTTPLKYRKAYTAR